ncbi:MAG: LuxR C-terminal-related transcriptional regulator [Caldilineaceae bacterium]
MTPEARVVSPRRTKLRPPRLTNDLIARPRLLERLDRLATLALIVAPAGYGKTTLVSMWLTHVGLPSAWVSLDEEDNDPLLFLTNIVAALRTLFPDFGSEILARLDALHGRAYDELAATVINELNGIEREFVLVLDDYHAVHAPAIHELLIQLLTHPPRTIHLVIATRHDPPLPWHLRTRGYLCELRARDLSFTETEAAEFLAKAAERPISPEEAKVLTEQAEGWVTSLRLAALNVRRQPTTYNWPAVLSGNQRNFVEYFAAEVIANLPNGASDFLLRTSILDELNGALCDFLAGNAAQEGRGAALLQQLEAEGVFVIALDDGGTWYRLHPLFRHALQHKLQATYSAGEITQLYERAVVWHEEQGLLEDAIRYALVNQQTAAAAGVVQRHRHQLLDAMDFRRLERWLKQFPAPAVAANGDLLLTKAWLMYVRFEPLEQRDCLEQLETLLATTQVDDQQARIWQGEASAILSLLHILAGEPHMAVLAGERALQYMPPDGYYVRSVALLHVAIAMHMAGESGFVDRLLNDAAADPQVARDLAIMRSQQIRHFIQLLAADLFAMRSGFPKLLQMAAARDFKTVMAWAHYFWGCASYLQNYLTEADEHFRAVLALADYANTLAYTHSAIGLALTRQAQGAPHEATAILAAAQAYLREGQLNQMLDVLGAFGADLSARQGRVGEALRWLAKSERVLPVDATPMFYVPSLAPVRVLLASPTEENLADAQAWLTRVRTLAVQTHNIHAEIQVHALQTVLDAASARRTEALATLSRALALAERGGILRVFADLSDQLAPLLDEVELGVLPEGVTAGFLWQVRSAIANDFETGRRSTPGRTMEGWAVPSFSVPAHTGLPTTVVASQNAAIMAPAAPLPAQRDLRQILTYREMDVLRLLSDRLTNKEIARQLGISTETVRQHTVKLFRKLNVDNRRQAIVVARAMGYFDD